MFPTYHVDLAEVQSFASIYGCGVVHGSDMETHQWGTVNDDHVGGFVCASFPFICDFGMLWSFVIVARKLVDCSTWHFPLSLCVSDASGS